LDNQLATIGFTIDKMNDQETLTDTQQQVLNLLPLLSIGIRIDPCLHTDSLLGVARSRFNSPYQRILFGLSVRYLLVDGHFLLQPFLIGQTRLRIKDMGSVKSRA
jgi:hypothetical protein